ncbi:hypothetical protein PENTCL1PPCAC_13011 [Pristionchus entomophagus]|uniref:Uncharacterized protein n=1 Tax=Pristionchus entomophagus TaxID=358040 RepID=A0AAV5T5H8_9BILA|nr:hypothetical protein PENTCL1PPCAC_13011 [Pristionchus entomophagus]
MKQAMVILVFHSRPMTSCVNLECQNNLLEILITERNIKRIDYAEKSNEELKNALVMGLLHAAASVFEAGVHHGCRQEVVDTHKDELYWASVWNTSRLVFKFHLFHENDSDDFWQTVIQG